MNLIKRWIARNKANVRQKLRDRVARDLEFFAKNDNKGLLHRRLSLMPEVVTVSTTTGGLRKASIAVALSDDFCFTVYDYDVVDGLKKAAQRVAERLEDKHSLRARIEHATESI